MGGQSSQEPLPIKPLCLGPWVAAAVFRLPPEAFSERTGNAPAGQPQCQDGPTSTGVLPRQPGHSPAVLHPPETLDQNLGSGEVRG